MIASYKSDILERICIAVVVLIVIFLSTYKLTESPPPWIDEGIVVQVSRALATEGIYGFQTSPDTFVSPGFVSTSYPVTVPIAVIFKIFGTDILYARMVMVLYIFLFFVTAFLVSRRLSRNRNVFLAGMFLLATFAPIYGHGKNVLGEIPGLFFLLSSILFLMRLSDNDGRRLYNILGVGLSIGLAIATKPIFILIGPAAFFTIIIFRKELFRNGREIFLLILALTVPIYVWFLVQFQHDSIGDILSFYGNPNSIDVSKYIVINIKRFLTEAQPFYTLVLFVLWLAGIFLRLRKKIRITAPEFLAFTTTTLVLLAYVRTEGFYRYFFTAEMLCILFVIPSIVQSVTEKWGRLVLFGFVILIAAQIYQSAFHSWVGTHYKSTRSETLRTHIGAITSDRQVFFYQTPEAVLFLRHNNYSEYFEITKNLIIGTNELASLQAGVPDLLVVPSDFLTTIDGKFFNYRQLESFDRYTILAK